MSHMYTFYDLFLTIMIAVLWLISCGQSYILTWSQQHLSVYSILSSTWYTSYSQYYRGTQQRRSQRRPRDMEIPQLISDLRRFLGMVNQLGKFSPQIAELSQPLRELLSTKRTWLWGSDQEKAFKQLKEINPSLLQFVMLDHFPCQNLLSRSTNS